MEVVLLSPRNHLGALMQRFDSLQKLVLGDLADRRDPALDDPLFRRIASTLSELDTSNSKVGQSDMAGLVRQALLSCGSDVPGPLRIPQGGGWPDDSTGRPCGGPGSSAGLGYSYLRARPWEPNWLDRGAGAAVSAAIQMQPRRDDRRVLSDPPIQELFGLKNIIFRPGQKTAVRSGTPEIPPGSTAPNPLAYWDLAKLSFFTTTALAAFKNGGLTVVCRSYCCPCQGSGDSLCGSFSKTA